MEPKIVFTDKITLNINSDVNTHLLTYENQFNIGRETNQQY